MNYINQELNSPNEFDIANQLLSLGFLKGPGECKCKSKLFTIQKDSNNKVSGVCFRCSNYACRLKYPIRINSFYSKFTFISLEIVTEVIKCCLSLNLNVEKAFEFMKNEKHKNVSIKQIYNIYSEIRNVIYEYYFRLYQNEKLGEINASGFYSVDESLFGHRKGKQVWILGAIDNTNRDFRLEATYQRDGATLEKFIRMNIEEGNHIITDSWLGYNFMNRPNSGYIHISHNHSNGIFGLG